MITWQLVSRMMALSGVLALGVMAVCILAAEVFQLKRFSLLLDRPSAFSVTWLIVFLAWFAFVYVSPERANGLLF